MNTLVQGGDNHGAGGIAVKLSRSSQKGELHFANEEPALEIFGAVWGQNFGSKLGKDFGVNLKAKCPHNSEISSDNYSTHTFA